MTEVAGAQKALGFMESMVRGRLEGSRRFDGLTYSRIATPAPDPYSRPQVVEVRSRDRLGDVGAEVSVRVKLGGFVRKAFEARDKNTGEVVRVTPVTMTLDAV